MYTGDECNGPFRSIQCWNNNTSGGVQRCFERMFENEDVYNHCVASGPTKILPPSQLESPDVTGGVEQCNCVCRYADRSVEEPPTGLKWAIIIIIVSYNIYLSSIA